MLSTRLSPITLGLLLALQPALALAETNATEAEMEVVSVTGKKVAYANNATDEMAKLQKSPIGNVMDLIQNMPGVNVSQGDAFGGDDYTTTISMRGFVIDRADQQLGITVDGVPNGGSAYAGGSKANRYLDSENTAFVEVGQGASDIASASLDALGGTINFVSSNPEAEQGARFAHTQGSFNARKDYLRYDSGQIFGNTTAYVSLSDSYNNRWIGTGSNGFSDRLHFEAKSVTEFESSKYTARLSYDDTHEDNYQPVSLAQFNKTPRWDGLTSAWTGDPDIDQNFAEAWSTLRENTLGYVKADYFLADNLELSITPYVHFQNGRGDWLPPYQHYVVDAKGNRITAGDVKTTKFTHVNKAGQPILDPKADLTGAKRVSSYRHTHYEKERFGATANLQWQLDSHQIRTGLWVEQQDRNQIRDWHAVIDAKVYHYFDETPYWVQFDDDYSNQVMKAYLQDQITLGDLQLTLGVQQYLVDVERTDNLNGRGHDKLNSDSDLLPSAGFVYQISPELEVFAGYSQNFKAISDKPLEKKKAAQLTEIEPETADNLDLGLRYESGDVRASATVYKVKFDNRVALLTYQTKADGTPNYDAVGDGDYDNIGGVDSQGFEASLNWQLTDTLGVASTLTLNDSTYSDDVLGVATGADGKAANIIEYKEGEMIAGIPERMMTLGLNYQRDAYRAGINAKYQGEYYGAAKHSFVGKTSVWNRDQIEAHTLWDLYFGYQKSLSGDQLINSLDVSLLINNLTDKAYISGGSEGAYLLGAERSISMTVSLGF